LVKSNLSLDEKEQNNIVYIDKVFQSDVNQQTKDNLINLMNMGFSNFELNKDLLEKNLNNIDVVVSKMFEN